ncbi:MAG: HAD family phosphatase [Clostridiales bacterium]|nr:HAD family phosphatase [Lachnospiraceae bacterium]MDD6619291.1 HAD family phosphatase [Clostridiales bacterium]MDY4770549.1 HAD family phosphatase [Lachnospiraceae bacterium]
MLKGIIFDMDGVLINTEPLHYRVWKKTFQQKGLEIEYENYKGCIGSTVGYLLDLIQKHYGVDFHDDLELVPLQRKNKAEMIAKEGFPKIPGVPQMLERVHEGGFLMAVASSSPEVYINQVIEMLGVKDYFQVLCSGENVKNPKPAPDVFLKAAKELGLSVDECLVIEDSTNGCRAAKAAGMVCLGYDNPDSGDQDLSIADGVIDDYEKLDAGFLQGIYDMSCKSKQNRIE